MAAWAGQPLGEPCSLALANTGGVMVSLCVQFYLCALWTQAKGRRVALSRKFSSKAERHKACRALLLRDLQVQQLPPPLTL